jgi:hypothetical protein
MNIAIVRAFVALRKMIIDNQHRGGRRSAYPTTVFAFLPTCPVYFIEANLDLPLRAIALFEIKKYNLWNTEN